MIPSLHSQEDWNRLDGMSIHILIFIFVVAVISGIRHLDRNSLLLLERKSRDNSVVQLFDRNVLTFDKTKLFQQQSGEGRRIVAMSQSGGNDFNSILEIRWNNRLWWKRILCCEDRGSTAWQRTNEVVISGRYQRRREWGESVEYSGRFATVEDYLIALVSIG